MNVSIIGITGFIGSNLKTYLELNGFNVMGIYREDLSRHEALKDKIEKSDVVINLSGAPVIGIWTRKKRKKIYDSRIAVTKKIVDGINASKRKIIYIHASAVGVYDNKNIHSENSTSYADDFLARVVVDWEGEVMKIRKNDVRWIILRLGIVIDKSGGYLGKQKFFLERGICFIIGKSDEYLPVISLQELRRIILFIMERKEIKGIVNAVAPFMVRVREFYRRLADAGGLNFFIKIPDICVRILLGKASLVILKGQCVRPERLLQSNYQYSEKSITDMLMNMMND